MERTEAELQAGIETRAFEGGAVLELSGTVDVSSAARLREEALRLASAGGAVILDWSGCRYLDAAALQTLLALKRRLEGGGGTLRVGRDAAAVREWLVIAGASSLLPPPNEPEAAAGPREP
jgi:anti-anti-sigma factor